METKKLTLPSGLEVEIGRPGPSIITTVYGHLPTLSALEAGDGGAANTTQAEREKTADLSLRLVCKCVKSHRLTPDFPPPNGYQNIDDVMDVQDFRFLQDAVQEYVEAAKEEAAPLPQTETG